MRTTINISDATLAALRDRARRTGQSLNSVIEATLQRGLSTVGGRDDKKIELRTHRVGIKPAYRGLSKNQLYDQLETEDFLKDATE